MTPGEAIFSVILAMGLVAWILFVIFGQVTVRKLRKNPATKHALGIEFASGWDIFNVAEALTLPKVFMRKMKRNAISMGLGPGFETDFEILYKHTTVFDRLLARVFYILFSFTGLGMIILIVLNWFGIFD